MSKVYQIITDRVIAALEEGTAPWRRPWGGEWAHPRSVISGKKYRGINTFLLSIAGYDSPYWLTFKQAARFGGHVRKGERGTPIVFWTEWETRDKHTGEETKVPVLRYYTGFNVAQCEGLPPGMVPETERPEIDFSPIDRCETVVNDFANRPEIQDDYDKAFYSPVRDLVGLPPASRFDSAEARYSTLFHELTHSTGHEKRLNRTGISDSVNFGSETYGKEELVAEMGAAFLCGHTGIEQRTLDNSAAYVAGWLRTIKRDAKLVVQAAGAAQKAADHVLGVTWN